MRKGFILFVARVFDLYLIGRFKLLHVALWLTGAAFLSSWRQVYLIRQSQGGAGAAFVTPNMEIGVLSKRWRAERNSWMVRGAALQRQPGALESPLLIKASAPLLLPS